MEEHAGPHNDPQNLQAPHDTASTASEHFEAARRRRSHKKSRNGCQHCKRRRIKCDESKPICGCCSHLSLRCNYDSSSSQLETPDLEVRKRGRPRKNWTLVSVEHSTASPSESNTTSLSTSAPLATSSADASTWHVERPLHLPWDAEDLELFFNYQNEVCAGMRASDQQLWKDRIPRLAFRRHGVLHLLLAISALHLSRQEPIRRDRLKERAEVHLAIGLHRTTDILPNLSTENCAELYVATILVCICTFAKGPGPGNLLVVADGAEASWWDLFRGVRIVVETIGIHNVFAGELGPIPSDSHAGQQHESSHHHHIDFDVIVDWEDAVGRLPVLISSVADESVRGACESALCSMTWCFQETYGTTVSPKATADANFHHIIRWLYCLSDKFVNSLKEKEPASLILLAYFTVLLQTLDSAWFMEGWAAYMLKQVSEILGRAWDEWLQWPALQSKGSSALLTRGT